MRLAIPNAPRPVRLHQVPGAVRRLAIVCALAAAGCAVLWGLGGLAGRWLSNERDFFENAIEVPAQVAEVRLPPVDRRERATASVTALYVVDGRHLTASVELEAVRAEPLGRGALMMLLVDPRTPSQPREASWARSRAGLGQAAAIALGVGLLVSLGLVLREVRRAVRRELRPLQTGMLVWLTPDEPLPTTRSEAVFAASYWREDVQFRVRARGRPGRAPVRNGEKVLAAVIPSEPQWVRVVDEDLAHALGWFQA